MERRKFVRSIGLGAAALYVGKNTVAATVKNAGEEDCCHSGMDFSATSFCIRRS